MEANNHFNYGTHSSVSANSGLKLSSGDSLYTNGSSMSFPHQAKNINGEMNVNGVTTVIGSGVPGSHPPTAPYPHMSNHHQNSMGYDYLWGGQSQYNPAMSSSPGLNMHQKQPPTGMMQPQSQHHFQGHGQYQHNGGMGSSRQPPVAAPPNVTLSGGQYWNRGNPGQQQMGYNSHSVYGAYQSAQVHPGIVSSQHHQQQQQQILQPTPHQQTPQHLHPHHHPHHHHHQQQQQQHQQPPQHYGMVPNGMPYYQHQSQHPPLPSPQPQPPPPQSQPPAQAQMMPPTAQNYTPPRGSPQHHNLGRGGTGSPLPMGVSSVQMISPTTAQEGGSPQSQTRERSPHGGNVGIPVSMQGRLNEAFTEVDNGYNGMERGPVGQRLSKSDSYPPKPPGPPMGPSSDYCQRAEPPTAQHTDMATPARESAMTVLPHSMSSPSAVLAPPAGVSTSPLSKAPTPPRVSAPPTLSSPGPPVVPSPVVVSSPPRNLTPPIVPSSAPSVAPRLSSPPLMVQGLRPPPATLGSPSSTVSASPPQPKPALTPPVSAPPPLASASSYSLSTPISALQQMVQGSRPPPLTSGPPAGAPREKPGSLSPVSGTLAPVSAAVHSSPAALPPSSTPAPPASVTPGPHSSLSTPPGPHPSLSAPPTLVSRAPASGTAPFESEPKPPQSSSAPLSPVSASPWASSPPPAASSPPNDAKAPRPTSHGPRALPTTGPPPLTSQAPKSASVCAPSSFMSAPPVLSAASGLASQVTYPTLPPKATATPVPEHEATENERGPAWLGAVGKPEAGVRQSEAEAATPPPKVEGKETLCTDTRSNTSFPDSCGSAKRPEKFAKAAVGALPEEESQMSAAETPVKRSRLDEPAETVASAEEPSMADSSRIHSSRVEDSGVTDESSSEDTSGPEVTSAADNASRMDGTSRFEDSSRMDNTSRFEDSSRMDKTSRFEDSSRVDGTSRFEDSSLLTDDASVLEEDTSRACDTTWDSFSSTGNLRDETQEGDTSQAEETMDRGLSTRESSLNDTSRMDESRVDSSQSNESLTGSFSPRPPPPYNKGSEVDAEGLDKPDSAGPLSGETGATLPVTLPVFETKDEGIASLEPPAECPVVPPLLPVADQPCPTAGGKMKTPGKTRKPRAPKSSTPVSQGPGQAQQKATIKTPKVAKIKKKLEKEGEGEKEKKEPARKRKRSAKVAADKPSGVSAEADLEAARQRAIQDEQIKAIIEACLATDDSPAEEKPKKAKKNKKVEPSPPKIPKLEDDSKMNEDDHDGDDSSTAGETPKRRAVATEEQVHFPMLHGWRREIRVKKLENRMKGETWYYSPCGRRMKQFPEVIKYLNRHQDSLVTREHFSFSPRMPVGDFYEERETPEGQEWCLLTNEEVPSMIMAITGRRGRPPNPDKEKPRRVRGPRGGQARRPGRPPKPTMVDLLSKVDARLLKRLEAKEAPTEEDKEKLAKIKKKMKRKIRMKRKEDAKNKKIKEDKKKAKTGDEPEANEQEDSKAEPPGSPAPAPPAPPHPAPELTPEPKKPGRRKRAKVDAPPLVQETDQERIALGKRVLGARSKAKALAKAQAEAQAAALAAAAAKRQAERKAQAQRRLEERKRQQLILEELKKPNEDMCLTDHRPLPELSRITGLVLSGRAFSHCLTVVEFLHSYGKVLGLDVSRDIPSLSALQEGLLGLGDGQGELQDLVLKLLEAALHDPGLPSFYQSVKILGEKLVDLELTRSTVSEGLRIFLEAHGFETVVCDTLRTKPFLALSPDTKAAILGFLVDELNGSNLIVSEIDNTLENMATYRKNKWIIEGKLRKLKSALARRTGRSEDDLCLEERRRSARVAEEEHLSLEESDPMERGSRRSRKEEAVLSDQSDSPTNASIPELERQIDKLTKRQAFFRKKLLQSSHSMRAVSLGQDRFRRRYWALPQIGGVLIEGPEEILTSEDILVAEVPVTFMKKEPKVEEVPVTPTALPSPPTPSSTPGQPPTSSPEDDPLPGTASLMSQPRGRGRPRKIKPEVELHLRTAKMGRRRHRSSKSGGEEAGPETNGTQNLTQAAFQSWLSQPQEGTATANGTGPEDSVKDAAEKQGQWFNLLPKEPCDSSSLTEPQAPASPGSTPPKLSSLFPLSSLPALAAPLLQSAQLPASLSLAVPEAPAPPPPPPPPPPPQEGSASAPSTPARPGRRRRRGSRGSSPARRGSRGGVRAGAGKRRGRPPCTVFQELEQQYFTQLVVKPIPTSMASGWWWITEPEELHATLQALHPRGTREKVLHKHLAKHMESLVELVAKGVCDPIFQVKVKVEEGDALTEALLQPWQVVERSLETDVSALRWVEDLEQRVISADLHLKVAPQSVKTDSEGNTVETPVLGFQPYTVPEADSTREDLQYYEHDADPRDDWIVRTKKEWSDLPRVATHPLDLAVLRLANLERNIERRYLKEPLWNLAEVVRLAPLTPAPGEENPVDVMSLESEITPRLRTWRQGLDRCRSAPQLCLCLLQLEKAIAWERSVVKVMCQVCRKGDNDEYLLLCDGCDRGCHMYCLKPKVTQVPEGDWFCPTCISQALGESQRGQRSAKQRVRVKKRRYEDDSSDEETGPRRAAGMATRHKDAGPLSSSSSRYSGDGGAGHSPSKRRRMTTRNQPDLTYCEIILMEMEAHADAWPFLEPVNPRLVPGYRRIVKNPMDFLTMRERLLQGGYSSCEEFAADAQLVFNNCELFNEDTSEVGVAGHAMRRFFESRWAEFYDSKDK